MKIVRGTKVRLLRDVTTRGDTKFRKGLVMSVVSTERELLLRVIVRSRRHYLKLHKNDSKAYLEVVSQPKEE